MCLSDVGNHLFQHHFTQQPMQRLRWLHLRMTQLISNPSYFLTTVSSSVFHTKKGLTSQSVNNTDVIGLKPRSHQQRGADIWNKVLPARMRLHQLAMTHGVHTHLVQSCRCRVFFSDITLLTYYLFVQTCFPCSINALPHAVICPVKTFHVNKDGETSQILAEDPPFSCNNTSTVQRKTSALDFLLW